MSSNQFDPSRVRVVAFDLFGTLVDMGDVPRDELRAYGEHLRRFQETGEWLPFRPPESWGSLRSFPDVDRGLNKIAGDGRGSFTLSNCPYETARKIVARNGLYGLKAGIIQLAPARVFKPDPRAYQTVCDVLDVPPEDVLMVTANEHFGDLEQSRALGMQACLIRGESDIPDLIALAERLGC